MNAVTTTLNKGTVATSSNVLYSSDSINNMLSLWFTHNDTNEVNTYDPGGSDSPIADTSMQVDGGVMLVSSWNGGGFGVYTIANDGTLTREYQDTTPNGSYTSYNSLAVDKVNHVAYVSCYPSTGLTPYDYSDVYAGGSTVIKGTTIREADGLFGDQFGTAYVNGTAIAGDYLYYSNYERYSYGEIHRWKISTGQDETVTVQNTDGGYRYGHLTYSPATDRIYMQHRTGNGETVVVTDASHATNVRAFKIRYDDISGINYYAYVQGVIEDSQNPNHVWMSDNDRIFKLDITNCIVDGGPYSTPTLLSGLISQNAGGIYTGYTRISDFTPNGADLIVYLPYSGWGDFWGWIDQENENIVTVPNYSSSTDHWSTDPLRFDYGVSPVKITAPDTTEYWVVGGYGADGHKFRVYADGDVGYLHSSGYITFGSLFLNDSSNIGSILINNTDNFYTPTGSSFSIQVSNNGGTDWENYTLGSVHTFSTTGNAAQVKISLTGNGKMSAYYLSKAALSATLFGDYDYNTPVRYVKTNLRGGY